MITLKTRMAAVPCSNECFLIILSGKSAWIRLFAFLSTLICIQAFEHTITNPPEDATHCIKASKGSLKRLGTLPGGGWDNLRNVDAALAIHFTYKQCKTTDDGRFLVPDTIDTLPRKVSNVETYAELFEHWRDYRSATATSINVDAGFTYRFSVSGQFSYDAMEEKRNQIQMKSVATRAQLRYVRYTAKLQPGAPLHSTFKNRLLQIARYIHQNRTEYARYESQLLVRDFGTHVITSIDAGAALVKEDHVKRDFTQRSTTDKTSIMAAASVSFFFMFEMRLSASHEVSQDLVDEYKQNLVRSKIDVFGGELFKAANYTANDWSEQIDNNLVAVDRAGNPLHFLITADALPELPTDLLYKLYSNVEEAVSLYYGYNTYPGCTNIDAPNFSITANVDDGSCKTTFSNMTFGGVFTKCRDWDGNVGLCEGLNNRNPKTGDYSCPSYYTAVLLHTHYLAQVNPPIIATVKTYWCAAIGRVPKQISGYLFGGLYTSMVDNPLTESTDCPDNFYSLRFGVDLWICISDDYELAYKNSVPFGGFIGCKAGNPLAIMEKHRTNLSEYFETSGEDIWPKHCPRGYNQHLATVAYGCQINYCVATGSLAKNKQPTIRRLPYMKEPWLQDTGNRTRYVYDPNTKEYKIVKLPMEEHNHQNGNIFSWFLVIGIVLFVVLIVLCFVFVVYRRRVRSNPQSRRSESTANTSSV